MTREPRTIVVGAAGQLGRDICARLKGDVHPLTRSELDVTNRAAVREKLSALQPTVVINCAAYNLVDKAEDEPESAFAVNAFAPAWLADACQQIGATLVHFSTNYVFGLDESRTTPYKESDAPGPNSIYGTSKLAGEYLVRSRCERHYVIRTCGLFGRWGVGGKGGNFVETMLRLAAQGKPIKVVDDQICTPSYTADVAEATLRLIQQSTYGLYHLTNSGECSWYEFARAIFGLASVKADLKGTTTKEFAARAQRPLYSTMTSEHPQTPKMRSWQDALAAYLAERGR